MNPKLNSSKIINVYKLLSAKKKRTSSPLKIYVGFSYFVEGFQLTLRGKAVSLRCWLLFVISLDRDNRWLLFYLSPWAIVAAEDD